MLKLTVFACVLFVVSGCLRHKPVTILQAISEPVIREKYAYKLVDKDQYVIWAESQLDFVKAETEIGCGICSKRTYGYVERVLILQQEK